MESQSQNCSHKGKVYPEGAEVCEEGLCMLCNKDGFEVPPEQSLNDDEELVDPGEAYFNHVME